MSNMSRTGEAVYHVTEQGKLSDLYRALEGVRVLYSKKISQLDKDQCRQVQTDSILFFSRKNLFGLLDSSEQYKYVIEFFDSMDDLLIFCNELEKISDLNESKSMNYNFSFDRQSIAETEQVKGLELR